MHHSVFTPDGKLRNYAFAMLVFNKPQHQYGDKLDFKSYAQKPVEAIEAYKSLGGEDAYRFSGRLSQPITHGYDVQVLGAATSAGVRMEGDIAARHFDAQIECYPAHFLLSLNFNCLRDIFFCDHESFAMRLGLFPHGA